MKKYTLTLIAAVFLSSQAAAFGINLGGSNTQSQVETMLKVIQNKGLACEKVTGIKPGFKGIAVTCDKTTTYIVIEKGEEYDVKIK